jgi:diacylglycerol O-acyltransferase
MICTNVPGPMIPLYCVGHLLLDHFPLVPLSLNMGLGAGVTSYNHKLFFGLMADPNVMPDVDFLKQCIDESYLELRAAAGVDIFDLPEFVGIRSNGVIEPAGVGN